MAERTLAQEIMDVIATGVAPDTAGKLVIQDRAARRADSSGDSRKRRATTILSKSGSDWNPEYLESLNITVKSVEKAVDILPPREGYSLSTEAQALIDLLADLSEVTLLTYPLLLKENTTHSRYYDPIYKAVYLTKKYSDHESAVDCLLGHLLSALGFNSGRLFAFPQLRVPIDYGTKTMQRFATADFTIIDVVSFYRCCFCEDKSVKDELKDCSPQIIAEAFALHQLNRKLAVGDPILQEFEAFFASASSGQAHPDAEASSASASSSQAHPDAEAASASASSDQARLDAEAASASASSDQAHSDAEAVKAGNGKPIIGVRVSELQFYFYSIPYSKPVLTALQSHNIPDEPTEVLCYPENGLNFLVGWERQLIIYLLDRLRYNMAL